MRQYEIIELHYRKDAPTGSQVNVSLFASFACGESTMTVKGFYAGDNTYIIRFLPCEAGEYHYKVFGIFEDSGSITVLPAEKNHGMVIAQGTHFRYQDGTRFLPFGTTVYAMAHQSDNLVEQTIRTLSQSPFNKVRICLFPKDYLYNKNEPPCFAFEKSENGNWDIHRPCFAFWERFEKILTRLQELEIQIDLILFHPYDRWGFSKMSEEEDLTYLDYLLRRFAAFPGIWWSLANEYDLCAEKTDAHWYKLEEFIAEHDPYHHLLSVHNAFRFYDYSRPNITHASMQIKTLTRLVEWKAKYKKPIMVDECCYEGNFPTQWGCLSGREMTAKFWQAYTEGTYCTHGETFSNNDGEIIWWAKGGSLHGESPKRIAFLKSVFEELGDIEPYVHPYFQILTLESDEFPEEIRKKVPADLRILYKAMFALTLSERQRYSEYEWFYQGQSGDEAFVYFYNRRCYAEDTIHLPENRIYRIEIIDTWEMTRTICKTDASGDTRIQLPGKEGIAVLAIAEGTL